MANDRTMMAESVSSVLESARIRRQSGRLNIELYSGGRFQEGEIYLQAGQPVFVRLGQTVGQEALTRLLSWRNIQFTFQLDAPGTTPLSLPASSGVASFPTAPENRRERTTGNEVANQPTNSPGIEWLAPQKHDTGRDIQSLPLTRRQRYIYFLVDGKRTLSDLSRCTGKTLQEIELILRELQAQGLVIF